MDGSRFDTVTRALATGRTRRHALGLLAGLGLGGALALGDADAKKKKCKGGLTRCTVGGARVCLNAKTDNLNCGTCGNACAGGQTCQDGSCACPGNRPDLCLDVCVDKATDEANCGACGDTCAAGRICCGGQCVDPATDTSHCGACGTACAVGGVCEAGDCACPAGKAVCGSACITACAAGTACDDGSSSCVTVTPPPATPHCEWLSCPATQHVCAAAPAGGCCWTLDFATDKTTQALCDAAGASCNVGGACYRWVA